MVQTLVRLSSLYITVFTIFYVKETMNILFFAWLTLSLLFLLFEASNPGLFYFISFAGGAVFSAAVSLLFPDAFFVQGLLFLVASLVTLGALRYWVTSRSYKYHPNSHTNVYALQGQRALVTKRVTQDEPGEVKIKGELWMARTEQSDVLEEGIWVRVVNVSGASLIVVRVSEKIN